MGCCGRGVPSSGPTYSYRPAPPAAPAANDARRYSHAFFEYTGRTALTAVGAATGKHYRFERPGARVAVDPADQASLAKVPSLRLVLRP